MPVESVDPRDVHQMTYEQARDELAEVVRGLEAGGLSLEQSLALWERGQQLADRAQRLLDDAQHRLDAAQRSHEANSSSSE